MAAAKRDTVLIVDDDDAVRHALRFLVEAVGHKVETFARAAELEASKLGHIMCLILDHQMPGMTGLQLAERLRSAGVKTPILLITGAPTPAIVARAAELGVHRVLGKPPKTDDLLTFISAANR